MSIIKAGEDNYTLICDQCGRKVKGFDDFFDAVDYKKENGWQSKKEDGEWRDACPSCREDA